ncbi:hypothetical protein LguiB_020327 [Lonicera macranthoides]
MFEEAALGNQALDLPNDVLKSPPKLQHDQGDLGGVYATEFVDNGAIKGVDDREQGQNDKLADVTDDILMEVVELELDIGENFGSSAKLEEAVCNHGFFMMAPNDWNPLTKTLTRPLRLDDSSTSAIVSVSHDGTNPNSLRVRIHPIHHHRPISSSDCQAVLVRTHKNETTSSPMDKATKPEPETTCRRKPSSSFSPPRS